MAEPKKETITLYHYADDEGAAGIKRDGKINMSTDTVSDATFGLGAYFTPLSPSKSRTAIVENNYDADTKKNPLHVESMVNRGKSSFGRLCMPGYFCRMFRAEIKPLHLGVRESDFFQCSHSYLIV